MAVYEEVYYNFDNLEDIERFTSMYLDAQNALYDVVNNITFYEAALCEIRSGKKKGHWIWYIFPQHSELGQSSMCKHYGLPSLRAASIYLENQTLRERLLEISKALLELEVNDLLQVMPSVDYYKIRSSCTIYFLSACQIFGVDSPEANIFKSVIVRYFCRIGYCELTISILKKNKEIEIEPEETFNT